MNELIPEYPTYSFPLSAVPFIVKFCINLRHPCFLFCALFRCTFSRAWGTSRYFFLPCLGPGYHPRWILICGKSLPMSLKMMAKRIGQRGDPCGRPSLITKVSPVVPSLLGLISLSVIKSQIHLRSSLGILTCVSTWSMLALLQALYAPSMPTSTMAVCLFWYWFRVICWWVALARSMVPSQGVH